MKVICDVEPVAKSRARTVVRNGKVWSYTPKKTKEYEDKILGCIKSLGLKPFAPHIALKLTAIFWRTRPLSILKAETKPVRKPDADNFGKGLADVLTSSGIVPDDAQITSVTIVKRFSTTGKGYIEFDLELDQ